MLRVIEVGPRDGLQNEATAISTLLKVDYVTKLTEAGLQEIEATSFVSPKWVPQLSDASELWPLLPAGPRYSALVPNSKGLDRALEVGVERIAVFTAASETFVRKNINMTIDESLDVFKVVIEAFRSQVKNGWVRGYLSTAFECPFEGRIEPEKTAEISSRLQALGVDDVCIGDTIGMAAPPEVKRLAKMLEGPSDGYSWHFHDTRGTAISNVSAALESGYSAFDASSGGLGGCPYAPGAGGNLATEDLVYFLERVGISTGIDLQKLAEASLPVLAAIGRRPSSKSQLAQLWACR